MTDNPKPYKVIGKYRETSKGTYTNKDTGLTIHLRQRKGSVSASKPAYFLAVHKPRYEYISSCWPEPNNRQRLALTNSGSETVSGITPESTYYIVYTGQDYVFSKDTSGCLIAPINSNSYEAKL